MKEEAKDHRRGGVLGVGSPSDASGHLFKWSHMGNHHEGSSLELLGQGQELGSTLDSMCPQGA